MMDSTRSITSTGRNAREIYETTGDSKAALELLLRDPSSAGASEKSSTQRYNEFLCQSMVSQRSLDDAWLKELLEIEKYHSSERENQSTLNRLSRWIAIHNRGLALLSLHRPREAWDLVWPAWKGEMMAAIDKNNKSKPDESSSSFSSSSSESFRVTCRTGLLLLQASLEPNFYQPTDTDTDTNGKDISSTIILLDWLQANIPAEEATLKFLLLLVKSQMDLSHNNNNTTTSSGGLSVTDDHVRAARKDLKNAMEIFQHKLKDDETAAESEQQNKNASWQQASALNLKANTERLKGNVKKSIVLLGEAKTSDGDDDVGGSGSASTTNNDSSGDQMHHYNNLALVYHSNGNPHLALHAWSKALTSKSKTAATIQPNGTAQSNGQTKVLYNASLACLQQQNYKSAYECMSRVISQWPFREDCWLRLAEACIGWHHVQNERKGGIHIQTANDSQGKPIGLVLQNKDNSASDGHDPTSPSPVLGSSQDIEQLEQNPLPRAKECLQQCLLLLSGNKTKRNKRQDLVLLSARLSMSYIFLNERNYPKALEYADLVLNSSGIQNNVVTVTASDDSDNSSATIVQSTIQRQLATARMYASEASCAMGDMARSMSYLLAENGSNDAIDKLASNLAGVTLEVASNHPQGKARLAKAQAMVRCNASAVTANLNHLAPAKQLAMSAQAMEGAYMSSSSGGEESYAKRVLIYCMLREGNSEAALTLLRSTR